MSLDQQASSTELAVKLPWQNQQWQRLIQLHIDKRLPHALLFSGPPGVGKSRFALALAHFLTCDSPDQAMPCGHCRQCAFNKANTHPDVKQVEPEEKGKQIKIDQIRGLVEFAGHTAQQGGYKVIIVRPAESMNIHAANALLKVLEEPSFNTLLILQTSAAGQLLATIRSRCQAVVFPEPAFDQALQWLLPLVSSKEQAIALLKAASGQPMTALSLLESDGISRYRQMNKDFLSMLQGRQLALVVAQQWSEYHLPDTLLWLVRCLSDVIRWRCAQVELAKDWHNIARTADIVQLFKLSDKILELKGKLDKGANPNHQMLLEEVLLESCDIFHGF